MIFSEWSVWFDNPEGHKLLIPQTRVIFVCDKFTGELLL